MRSTDVMPDGSVARAWTSLARVSNAPTVIADALAGAALAGAGLWQHSTVIVAIALTLMYTAGMLLNDAFDLEHDRRVRPERPLPSGRVRLATVYGVGALLLAAGAAMVALMRATATLPVLLLGVAIVTYDLRHKGNPLAPLVMGSCRGLAVLTAAAVGGDGWTTVPVEGWSVVVTAYVTWLSLRARPARAPWERSWVPMVASIVPLALWMAMVAPVANRAAALAAAAVWLAWTVVCLRRVPDGAATDGPITGGLVAGVALLEGVALAAVLGAPGIFAGIALWLVTVAAQRTIAGH